MSNFINIRRQKFIFEGYYEKVRLRINDDIKFTIKSTSYKDDNYTSGDAIRWKSIASSELSLLFLEYTAGIVDISKLNEILERSILAFCKQGKAIGKFHNMEMVAVFKPEETVLLFSLSMVLNRRDLIKDVIKITTADDRSGAYEDEFINRLFRIYDSSYPILAQDEYFLDIRLNRILLCGIDDKNRAVELLADYLSDWYKSQKYEFWYNSHLDMENRTSYVGYWCFEAAMLVYLLDLDDSSLHKYLFYPKDIVQWIRNVNPLHKNKVENHRYTDIILDEGKKALEEGYYEDHFTQKIIYLKVDDIAPIYSSKNDVKTRVFVWRKLSNFGLSETDSEKLRKVKK